MYDFSVRKPYDWIREKAASEGIEEEKLDALPRRWEKIGDVVIIRIPGISPLKPEHHPPVDLSSEELHIVGAAFADVLGARTVVVDKGGISGELRQPDIMVIYGSETKTVHKENGILYSIDVAKVMFSSGNVDERIRMGREDLRGQNVLDMFAGIGYFTLPVARYSGAEKVIAVEKNPDSYALLLENISINSLEGVVEPRLGDNRMVSPTDWADSIIMGYLGGTLDFLPAALQALKPEGGRIYFHEVFEYGKGVEATMRRITSIARKESYDVLLEGHRRVKNYSPGRYHGVLTIRLE